MANATKARNFKEFDSNDWTNYLTRLLGLNADESSDLLHDINNLRGNEWTEVLQANNVSSAVINKFIKFCKNPTIH